jgi:hypothetical protein
MSLTIMSQDGRHKAVVTEDADGPLATYFRLMHDDSRGRAEGLRPAWRKLRSSSMRLPFHAALDAATLVVDQL